MALEKKGQERNEGNPIDYYNYCIPEDFMSFMSLMSCWLIF